MNGAAAAFAGGEEFGFHFFNFFSEVEEAGVDFIAQAVDFALDVFAEEAELGFADEFGFDGRFADEKFFAEGDHGDDRRGGDEPGFDGAGGWGGDLGEHKYRGND